MDAIGLDGSAKTSSTDFEALAVALGFTGRQWDAWATFVAAWQRAYSDRDDIRALIRARCSDRAPSLPDMLRMQTQMHVVDLDATQRLERATRDLYEQLSSRQQDCADRLLSPLCRTRGDGGSTQRH